MRDTDVAGAVRAWLLPAKNPKVPLKQQPGNYDWSEGEIDEALLKKSTPLPLTAVPTEREYIEIHSFKYVGAAQSRVYVRVAKGLKAFGGFILGSSLRHASPPCPNIRRCCASSAMARCCRCAASVASASCRATCPTLGWRSRRVLPEQLQHLAFSNDGSFASPDLSGIEADDLVEREERRLKLPADRAGQGALRGRRPGRIPEAVAARRLPAQPAHARARKTARSHRAQTLRDDAGEEHDSRLVVLTDLGMIVKKALDGSRDVFVQSLAQRHAGGRREGARHRTQRRNAGGSRRPMPTAARACRRWTISSARSAR